MMITEGILTIELLNEGSKSEGRYAILAEPDERRWMLYRHGVYPANDDFFAPFANHHVNVEGEQEVNKYIRVENITITDETKEELENEQNDMP